MCLSLATARPLCTCTCARSNLWSTPYYKIGQHRHCQDDVVNRLLQTSQPAALLHPANDSTRRASADDSKVTQVSPRQPDHRLPDRPPPLPRCTAPHCPAVVSDFGNGGQVLIDAATFDQVKDRLQELGAVDHYGYNDRLLVRREQHRSLFLSAKRVFRCVLGVVWGAADNYGDKGRLPMRRGAAQAHVFVGQVCLQRVGVATLHHNHSSAADLKARVARYCSGLPCTSRSPEFARPGLLL